LVTQQLLANIPRLEIVRAILSQYETSTASAEAPVPDETITENEQRIVTQGARLLRVASDFDALESRGNSTAAALALMERRGHYVPEMLVAIGQLSASRDHVEREVTLQEVEVGMVLADDLTTSAGSVMVVRGYEFTRAFVQRCHGYPPGWLKEPIRVLVPIAPAARGVL
jgi:hypothetical protein